MSVQAPPPTVPSELDVVPYEALGRPITGPRAITGDWQRFWHLTFNIALMQWKLRFFGSVLGYFWQLVQAVAAVPGALRVLYRGGEGRRQRRA